MSNFIEQAEKLRWFQSIDVNGYVTNGVVPYCNEQDAYNRFGMPKDLKGKKVLDVGCNNGYFSFLAEKRGGSVVSIDPNQDNGDAIKCFNLLHNELKSQIYFEKKTLRQFVKSNTDTKFDVILYYGVLYHVLNPLYELELLYDLLEDGGTLLIETAVTRKTQDCFWELDSGCDGDTTNQFYPSPQALIKTLSIYGFKNVEMIYNVDNRATFKMTK